VSTARTVTSLLEPKAVTIPTFWSLVIINSPMIGVTEPEERDTVKVEPADAPAGSLSTVPYA
jgi:hypothetical protein